MVDTGASQFVDLNRPFVDAHRLVDAVPDAKSTRHRMKMPNGVEHDMLMPGMLSPEELSRLDAARGPDTAVAAGSALIRVPVRRDPPAAGSARSP